MGTRGVYTFVEGRTRHHLFSHWDNYPTGAASKVQTTLASGLCWELPRWEADEFAAAMIAANKAGGGNYRLLRSRTAACDVEYGYTFFVDKKTHKIMVEVAQTNFWGEKPVEVHLWTGLITDFTPENMEARGLH